MQSALWWLFALFVQPYLLRSTVFKSAAFPTCHTYGSRLAVRTRGAVLVLNVAYPEVFLKKMSCKVRYIQNWGLSALS